MTEEKKEASPAATVIPFPACLRYDVVSGFLVFLIALPLCLAIAKASGFPPIGGVLTAIVGGIFAPMLSNSELTIKGPAAGLIAIVAGCVEDMKLIDNSGPYPGYQMALAVGATAAVFQILFGLFKAGKLGDFFPTSAVHGLLASIGVMIMIRQILVMFGVVTPKPLPQEAWKVALSYPSALEHWNLPVAIVGLTSLAILIGYQFIPFKRLKLIPVQLIVLVVAIPLASFLHLKQWTPEEEIAIAAAKQSAKADNSDAKASASQIDLNHSFDLGGKTWSLPPDKFLINVPTDFRQAIVYPDFSALKHGVAWKWIAMFAIIASLESLLSAKAVDLIDPCKRKTNLDRDLLGCGVANLLVSCIGGLPMISEIVRSRANVDNGAKSRFSNVFHGVFLLLFAALLPFVLKMIPNAALAAMLTFTGFRLAHPREFVHMLHIGKEQLLVFVTTIIAIIFTDLLIGVIIGMLLKFAVNYFRGLPFSSTFSSHATVVVNGDTARITPQHATVFSNWLSLRNKIEECFREKQNVLIDFSSVRLVDHTVMGKLNEMQRDFALNDLKLEIVGQDGLVPTSSDPTAARIRQLASAI